MSGTTDSMCRKGEIKLQLYGRTDVGQLREHNEDSFLVADLSRKVRDFTDEERELVVGDRGMVFAVCDGMGGAAAGEVASSMAVNILHEQLSDIEPSISRDELARRLVDAIKEAGLHIFKDGRADRKLRGMGTTATVATFMDDRLFLGQVGDSRAYVLRGDRLVQVTRDQSLVNQLIEAGQLTEEEAETFEHNNIILQALGTADVVQVDLTYVDLRRGDTLLLCSDGLSGMLRADEMREVLIDLKGPFDACKELIDRANSAGGHDNITVVIAKFDGAGFEPPTVDDAVAYRRYPLPDLESDPGLPAPPPSSGSGVGEEVVAAPGEPDTVKSGSSAVPRVESERSERPPPESEPPSSGRVARGLNGPSSTPLPRSSRGADLVVQDTTQDLPLAGFIVVVALLAVALLGIWLLR